MSKMVHITINGKVVQASEGEMLLAVIRREGIEIPATCHHEAVEPFGACRLCTVEITKEEKATFEALKSGKIKNVIIRPCL